jgi:hypothetical protein
MSAAQDQARRERADDIVTAVLRGIQQVVSFTGRSQYAGGPSGVSACGLAAFNCARVILGRERGGCEGRELLSAMVQREAMEVSEGGAADSGHPRTPTTPSRRSSTSACAGRARAISTRRRSMKPPYSGGRSPASPRNTTVRASTTFGRCCGASRMLMDPSTRG